MREDLPIWAGLVLIAAWAAVVRVPDSVILTEVLRTLAAAGGLGLIFMILPGAKPGYLAALGALYVMFMWVPLLLGAALFAFVRHAMGTKIYVEALVVPSAVFLTTYPRYLRS
jgi:hypothetical protein